MFSIVIDMNTKNCKEELIEITTTLIRENKGDVDKVTIRDIANKSGVSVGLINYHFGNKDNLITECVQSIITGVIKSFRPTYEIEKWGMLFIHSNQFLILILTLLNLNKLKQE